MNGTGNGAVRFAVQANGGAARQGSVQVAGQTITVSQSAGAPETCDFGVSPSSANVGAQGIDVTVNVSVNGGTNCNWTATANDAFISVKSGASGSGAGAVVLAVAANGGEARTGTATVAGRTVTVQQDGTTPACAFSVSPTHVNAPAAGATAIITIAVTQGSSCAWIAQSQASFITIVGGSAGVGNGSVSISVAMNSGAARSGSVVIAGTAVTVNQTAAANGMVAVVSYTSDAGDIVGRGQTNSYTLTGPAFTVSLDPSLAVLAFNTSFSSTSWLQISLAAPSGQQLVPGLYLRAERTGVRAPARPGLEVSANSNGCNKVTGRFLVAEASYTGNLINRFHARFEQHCDGVSAAFRGEIWIDAQGSTLPPSLPQFPPASSPPATFLTVQSDPGSIGGPNSLNYTLTNGVFSSWGFANGSSVRTNVGAPVGISWWWQLVLSAPNGQPLQIGTYENAARYPSSTQPGLDFFGLDGFAFSCNTSTGRFVVLEIVYGPQGELERLRATFETKCTGATAGLHGEIYIVADPWR
jgi:hypothetical protein